VGGFAGYRVGRWARRGTARSAALAEHIALAAGSAAPAPARAGHASVPNGQALADTNGQPEGAEPNDGQTADPGGRAGTHGNGRARAAAGAGGTPAAAPPLHLPARGARGADDAQPGTAGWAHSGVEGAGVTRP